MKMGRTLPPAAAPIGWENLFSGVSAVFSNESELNRFSDELKGYFDKSHCFLVSSGKAALTLILDALKELHPDRDEVIIPAYTCYSVPSAIIRSGLKIKLCDTAADSLDFDFELLKPLLTSEKLLCVVPTHLFGLPADVMRLKRMITDHEVTVIEDAAQAMGGEWQGNKLGTLGDVSFFSLGRGKAFSTVEGGAILTNNDKLASNLKQQLQKISCNNRLGTFKLFLYALALNIFLRPALFWVPKLLPFLKLGETVFCPDFKVTRMTPFQAGLAKNWAEDMEAFRMVRQINTRKYMSVLDTAVFKLLFNEKVGIPDLIRLPVEILDEQLRSNLLNFANNRGLGVAVAYPGAVCDIPEIADMFRFENYQAAKKHSKQLLTFPVHPFLNTKDLKSLNTTLRLVSESK